jgi:hypothetical protein
VRLVNVVQAAEGQSKERESEIMMCDRMRMYNISFKKFPELVYYTDISNFISIYTTFPSKYVPGRNHRHLPTFLKFLEAFLETNGQCSHRFCSDFLSACKAVPTEHFVTEIGRREVKGI